MKVERAPGERNPPVTVQVDLQPSRAAAREDRRLRALHEPGAHRDKGGRELQQVGEAERAVGEQVRQLPAGGDAGFLCCGLGEDREGGNRKRVRSDAVGGLLLAGGRRLPLCCPGRAAREGERQQAGDAGDR